MITKIWTLTILLCGVTASAFAAPILTVSPGGIQAGNWV
jgi:hypothetical protein